LPIPQPVNAIILEGDAFSDDDVPGLECFPKLAMLGLNSRRVTNKSIRSLAARNFTHLTEIDLYDSGVDEGAFRYMNSIVSLRNVRLGYTGIRTLNGMNDAFMMQITTLDLTNTEIGDDSVPQLLKMKNLKFVYLTSTKITDAKVKEIRSALPIIGLWH
jgi:hypothetical protein